MNINQFQTRVGEGVALVDFSAAWCAPCKAQKPILKALSKRYRSRVLVFEMNVDAHREVASKMLVQSIPTLILFRDGKEIKRFVGFQPEITLVDSLDAVLTDMGKQTLGK